MLEVVDELEDEGLAYDHPTTIDFEEITNVELEEDALDDYEEPETDQVAEEVVQAEETNEACPSAEETNPRKPL